MADDAKKGLRETPQTAEQAQAVSYPRLLPITNELVDDGAGHVVAVGRTRGKVQRSGKAFEVRSVHVWTVRQGKAARFEAYADTEKMLEVLGRH